MDLDQILAHISSNYNDEDILALVADMAAGNLAVRKQLADLVCRENSNQMSTAMLYEVSKWGVNDDLSQCKEIRDAAQP